MKREKVGWQRVGGSLLSSFGEAFCWQQDRHLSSSPPPPISSQSVDLTDTSLNNTSPLVCDYLSVFILSFFLSLFVPFLPPCFFFLLFFLPTVLPSLSPAFQSLPLLLALSFLSPSLPLSYSIFLLFISIFPSSVLCFSSFLLSFTFCFCLSSFLTVLFPFFPFFFHPSFLPFFFLLPTFLFLLCLPLSPLLYVLHSFPCGSFWQTQRHKK